jgi:iron complex transport system substrate-binding protein
MRLRSLLLVLVLGVAACSSDPVDDAGGGTGGTQEITHAMGTTAVPKNPQRVVVLDTDKIDTAVTLGAKLVGAAKTAEVEAFPSYLGELKDVKPVGLLAEPDLEAIAALKPDLILGSKFRQEKFYDELTAIAPTVFTERVGVTWKQNFLLDGKALGEEQKAKDLLAGYEKRARDLGASVANAPALKVSIVRFMPAEIRVYGPEGFSGIVVKDAGFGRPERQLLANKDDKRFDKVSPERVAEVDGDVIFVSAYGAKAEEQRTTVTAGNLWKNLSAVKAGKVYPVADETWMTGIGVTAAGRILDDLQKHLAGK